LQRLLSFQTGTQAAKTGSIEDNQYFCVGVMMGMVNGYVPVLHPIMDKFSFSSTFLPVRVISIEVLNDASSIYSIEAEELGLERIHASCAALDYEKTLYLSYEIKAVNIIDVGFVGTIQIEDEKDHEKRVLPTDFFWRVLSFRLIRLPRRVGNGNLYFYGFHTGTHAHQPPPV
jgi:hypothetical protein